MEIRHKSATSIARFALIVAVVAGCASPLFAQTVYRLQERVWLPYDPDNNTLGLFHLDQHPRISADQAMDDVDADANAKSESKAPQLLTGLNSAGAPQAETGADHARDASSSARAARLLGKAAWIEKGRFRGGLRLEGGSAALVTPDYPVLRSGQAFTAEAWFNPDKGAAGVLIYLSGGSPKIPAIEVRRTADGEAQLFFDGKVVPKAADKCPAGEWTHVAMVIYPPRDVGGKYRFESRLAASTIVLYINAIRSGIFEDARIGQTVAMLAGQVCYGNNSAQTDGLACGLDEARVSSVGRQFYPMLLSAARTPGDKAIPEGPPLVRETKDQMFYAKFEDAIDAEGPDAPKAELANAVGIVTEVPAKQSRPAVFVDGVHGRSLLTGASYPSAKFSPTSTTSVIDLARGSIELWFSPQDWDNRERQKQFAPMEGVTLFRTVPPDKSSSHLSVSINRLQPFLEANPPALYLNPGTWYHLVVAWDGPKSWVFINGAPAPPDMVSIDRREPAIDSADARASALLVGATNPSVDPGAHATIIDEVRAYRRALSPEEVANVFGRYLPNPETTPLPFARLNAWLSTPLKTLNVNTSILAGDVSKTRSLRVTLLQGERDEVALGPYTLPLSEEGVGDEKFIDQAVAYGTFRVRAEYLASDGSVLHSQIAGVENPLPPWLNNTIGMHEGQVLPGWSEMAIDHDVISLSCKKITLSPSGWPTQFNLAGNDVLARPIVARAKFANSEVAWKPVADVVVVEESRPDRIIVRGESVAGDWKMSTRLTSEFDGLIKFETTLTPGASASIDEFTIEVPMKNEHAAYYGFWTGHPWFRAACDYMAMPQKEGVIFASNKHGRAVNAEIAGSFIPFVVLADDRCAINWFAENDKGWTKTRDKPSVEVIRDATTTTLVLHVIQTTTPITQPTTITFGLHLAPVKAAASNRRSIALKAEFGFVDAFSKQPLKTDFPSQASFGLLPAEEDWDAAAARADKHRRDYKTSSGYEGPLLYLDRNYVAVPHSANNFVPIWMRSGCMRYLPDARDMGAWCINEWLKRKLVVGIYIDDVWGQVMKDPETGPAYKLPDGKIQPGFEFFDFNTYLRRLRWTFIDNKAEPLIWLHATQTFYLPICSYADMVLDGEDRFPAIGAKGDFLAYWGLPRLQFNQPDKFGLTTTWMFKAPADSSPVPTAFAHWKFRQTRAYQAGCLAHDLAFSNDRPECAFKLGALDDSAEFHGYWQQDTPISSGEKDIVASIFVTKTKAGKPRVGVVIVNLDSKPRLASIKFDLAKLGFAGTLGATDIDSMNPPQGEDPTQTVVPQKMSAEDTGKKDATTDLFNELKHDIEHPDPSRGEGNWFNDHNARLEGGTLRARVRPRDYRAILIE